MKEFIARNIQGGLIAVPFLFSSLSLAQTSATGVAPASTASAAGVTPASTASKSVSAESKASPSAIAPAGTTSASKASANLATAALAQEPAKSWSLPVSFEYASSLHHKSAYERTAQESLTLIPTYKISESMKVSLMSSLYKDNSNTEEGGNTALDNTRLSFSNSKAFSNEINWTQSLSGTIPTNRNLREQTSYQGSLHVSTGLALSELIFGSSLKYSLSYTRNLHEFNIAADGSFNMRESLSNSLELGLPLIGPVSLSASFAYIAGKTYRDDLRTKFATEASLNWQANDALSVSAATSNEGNAYGPNGTDSNIEFFNDNSSLVKLGLTYLM